jgi:hypothetical protein
MGSAKADIESIEKPGFLPTGFLGGAKTDI